MGKEARCSGSSFAVLADCRSDVCAESLYHSGQCPKLIRSCSASPINRSHALHSAGTQSVISQARSAASAYRDVDVASVVIELPEYTEFAPEVMDSTPPRTSQIFYDSNLRLHQAVQENSPELVDIILRDGDAVDSIDSQGKTALMIACKNKFVDISIVKQLVGRMADFTMHSLEGMNAWNYACAGGHASIVEYLMHSIGFDVDQRSGAMGLTPIEYAINGGNQDVVNFFLSIADHDNDGAIHSLL